MYSLFYNWLLNLYVDFSIYHKNSQGWFHYLPRSNNDGHVIAQPFLKTLQWRHNECYGLCVENHPMAGELPCQRASMRKICRLVGWLVIEVEQLFSVLKQWITAEKSVHIMTSLYSLAHRSEGRGGCWVGWGMRVGVGWGWGGGTDYHQWKHWLVCMITVNSHEGYMSQITGHFTVCSTISLS